MFIFYFFVKYKCILLFLTSLLFLIGFVTFNRSKSIVWTDSNGAGRFDGSNLAWSWYVTKLIEIQTYNLFSNFFVSLNREKHLEWADTIGAGSFDGSKSPQTWYVYQTKSCVYLFYFIVKYKCILLFLTFLVFYWLCYFEQIGIS